MSLLLTLNISHTFFSNFIVNFEQVNAGWDKKKGQNTSHLIEIQNEIELLKYYLVLLIFWAHDVVSTFNITPSELIGF